MLRALLDALCLMFFYRDQIYPSTKRRLNLNVFSSSTQMRQIFNMWTQGLSSMTSDIPMRKLKIPTQIESGLFLAIRHTLRPRFIRDSIARCDTTKGKAFTNIASALI